MLKWILPVFVLSLMFVEQVYAEDSKDPNLDIPESSITQGNLHPHLTSADGHSNCCHRNLADPERNADTNGTTYSTTPGSTQDGDESN